MIQNRSFSRRNVWIPVRLVTSQTRIVRSSTFWGTAGTPTREESPCSLLDRQLCRHLSNSHPYASLRSLTENRPTRCTSGDTAASTATGEDVVKSESEKILCH